jgi:uncharacterized protein
MLEDQPNMTGVAGAAATPAVPQRTGGQRYDVTWVASVTDVPPELWARCFPPPLEGLWWYAALERAGLHEQFTFAYAAISRDGEPVGIAPAFRMDLPLEIVLPDAIAPAVKWIGKVIPALRYERTLFIGSPCAEEGTIGLIPGVTLADVLPDLRAAVEARAKQDRVAMIVWKDVPDAAAASLSRLTMDGPYFKVQSFPGTEIDNLPKSFDGYLAGMSSNQRYQLRKKLKASRAALDLECTVVQAPSAAVMTEIWGLFMQTYERATTRFEKLTPAFFDELAKAPSTHFILLRRRGGGQDGGQLVAFMLCYFEAEFATNKFIGIDYTLGDKTFLYFRLFEEFLVWATGKGATALASGQTGYRAKLDLGHDLVPLSNFARHRIWLVNLMYGAVGKTITWSTLDPDLKAYLETKARKGPKS